MDTSEEYINVIIVHLYFFFSLVYVMYLNIASYSYGKRNGNHTSVYGKRDDLGFPIVNW